MVELWLVEVTVHRTGKHKNGQRDARGQGQAPTPPLYEDLIFVSIASNSDPILRTLKSTNIRAAPGGCHPAPTPLL